jgi:hypothetical protein
VKLPPGPAYLNKNQSAAGLFDDEEPEEGGIFGGAKKDKFSNLLTGQAAPAQKEAPKELLFESDFDYVPPTQQKPI